MLAPQQLQLGAILILLASDSENQVKDPLDNPQCGMTYKPSADPTPLRTRIIGGSRAFAGAWPWQVALIHRGKLVCGGTLIASDIVLTAAHCVRKPMYIIAGEYDLNDDDGREQKRRVVMAFKHPLYDDITVENDIALLKLNASLKLNQRYVWPACLPEQDEELDAETMATIIGWGAISFTREANQRKPRIVRGDTLNEAKVPVVDFDECQKSYGRNLASYHIICAGYKEGKADSCAGDSGGPLLVERNNRWHVYGVTSFGEDCGKEGKYGVYSQTSNYVDWMRRIVAKYSADSYIAPNL